MAVALQTERVTPADELRHLLARCEGGLINLTDPASAAELFDGMDQIADLLPQIEAIGVDLRAESTRWQGLQERLLARGRQVLRAWQGQQRLAAARQARAPVAEHWWWWIDQRMAERRRSRLRRSMTIVIAAALLLALAAMAVSRLFPVDPAVRAAYRLRLSAETALGMGDLAGAYPLLQQAVQATPDDASLLVLYGAVAEAQGDAIVAGQAWQQARDRLQGAEGQFLTERGLAFLRLQQTERAISELEAAAALEPASARTRLALGGALEAAGRLQEALAAYEQAAELAEAGGNAELVATARVQMATLLQRMQMAPPMTPQP
ncbi:MAG: hypothetical protein V9H69_17490 [Anaerolineae bacterium]|jgi:tetratricopeptide (TPR) repeat protein